MGFQTPSVFAMACTHIGTDSTELLSTVLTASVQGQGTQCGSTKQLLPTHLSQDSVSLGIARSFQPRDL